MPGGVYEKDNMHSKSYVGLETQMLDDASCLLNCRRGLFQAFRYNYVKNSAVRGLFLVRSRQQKLPQYGLNLVHV